MDLNCRYVKTANSVVLDYAIKTMVSFHILLFLGFGVFFLFLSFCLFVKTFSFFYFFLCLIPILSLFLFILFCIPCHFLAPSFYPFYSSFLWVFFLLWVYPAFCLCLSLSISQVLYLFLFIINSFLSSFFLSKILLTQINLHDMGKFSSAINLKTFSDNTLLTISHIFLTFPLNFLLIFQQKWPIYTILVNIITLSPAYFQLSIFKKKSASN